MNNNQRRRKLEDLARPLTGYASCACYSEHRWELTLGVGTRWQGSPEDLFQRVKAMLKQKGKS